MKAEKPSDLELQILSVLWRVGPATARDVLEAMPDGKKRAYTSVLSVMQVMEKKGLLTRHREGLTDHWQPLVSQSGILGPFFRTLIANVFGGEPREAMQHLLRESDLQREDIDELRKLLDAHEAQKSSAAKPKKKGPRS